MKKLVLHILLICALMLVLGPTFSNVGEDTIKHKPFDKAKYEKAIEGVDYTEIQPPQKKKNKTNFDFGDRPNWNFGVLSEFFKVVFIVFVVGLLAFLIFRLVDEKYLSKGKKLLDKKVLIENLEEYIHEVDLEGLLKEAIANNNYKLAIRIYYLIVIKTLSQIDLIHWKKEKTNGEYLSEMYGNKHFTNFQEATMLFERIWYGDVTPNKDLYDRIAPKFDALNKAIKPIINITDAK